MEPSNEERTEFVNSTFGEIRKVLQFAQADASNPQMRASLENAESKLNTLWAKLMREDGVAPSKKDLDDTIGKLDSIKSLLIELSGRDLTVETEADDSNSSIDESVIPTFDPVEVRPDSPASSATSSSGTAPRHRLWESWLGELRADEKRRESDTLGPSSASGGKENLPLTEEERDTAESDS